MGVPSASKSPSALSAQALRFARGLDNDDGNGGDDNVAAAPIMNQGQRFNA